MTTNRRSPLICLVGPTATGKTDLAVKLQTKLKNSALISADSRQVYRGMDIVTGKDHPQSVKISGIDLVNPDEECSVSLWYQAVIPRINSTKYPLVVGGTGLYLKALTDGIPTMFIPPNQALRNQLLHLSIPQLQTKLQSLSSARFAQMNHSDSLNPRRLIRAIEIASSLPILTSKVNASPNQLPPSLIIGLRPPPIPIFTKLIRKRVLARLKMGALNETKTLLANYGRDLISLTAIGYRSLIPFLDGKIARETMITQWVSDEISYAKRQLTWFNKVPTINWFSASDPHVFLKATNLVDKFVLSCYDNPNTV